MMINPKDAELQIIYLENRVKDLSAENFALKERLRDEFAMAALPGLIGRSWGHLKLADTDLVGVWAKASYLLADEMLKAREQSK